MRINFVWREIVSPCSLESTANMTISPLRYPGGKSKLYRFFCELINANGLYNCDYCEPYAGGAGLAIKLLASGFVQKISLNDIDPGIYAFWEAVLRQADDFCDLIEHTPITVEEWHRQKSIWRNSDATDLLQLGFATYFLNRTSRSGIIENAGPIGGYKQDGTWKIDARFTKKNQILNIQFLSRFKDQIEVHNEDALSYVRRKLTKKKSLVYLDPPYYVKGSKLYKNFYEHADHEKIASLLRKNRDKQWVLSYDDVPQIRELYPDFVPITYALNYSAGKQAVGREVIYLSNCVALPDDENIDLGIKTFPDVA